MFQRFSLPQDAAAAVAWLEADKLLALPTETVYGLAALTTRPNAIASVFALKGRPSGHPLIVHLAASADWRVWTSLPKEAHWVVERLALAFWPGPLTLVLPKAAGVSDAITGGKPSVALRCPRHPVAQCLLEAVAPAGLVAPSANRFGRISPTTAAHVMEEFSPLPEAASLLGVLESEAACHVGLESTILDLCDPWQPVLLRPGLIAQEALEVVLEQPIHRKEQRLCVADAEASLAAGSLASHYAPCKPCYYRFDAADALPAGTGILCIGEPCPTWQHTLIVEALPACPRSVAQGFYAALRRLDAHPAVSHIHLCLPAAVANEECWLPIWDRCSRASLPYGEAQG